MTGRHVDIGVLNSGRFILYTETGGDWNRGTWLYAADTYCYFSQESPAGSNLTIHSNEELREHVKKLLPILFTPEELRELLAAAEGSPPITL